ncbi:glycerophosphodiester phosphodiesterase family protein [Solicola gregarius]|uniref:Glycerophosphodiester phosphodiesterase n=1 Tax=Solicola gregarius TaxID=2908642 RepID=A0AA46TH26_9ACTN|nr:glycerophosphodiester phosphodiesterase family protein [Solicola gregarius]UYM04699.1 glycerophosphodiester phosphodiesterase [Solicola gregarius]
MSARRPAGLAAVALLLSTAVALGPATNIQAASGRPAPEFDLQAHRGGVALTVESTVPAFARALRTGVSTLELDVQITEDREAVVTHDRVVNSAKCRDTAPAHPGDPAFPYVGDYVKDLTLEQVRTLDCGSQTLSQFPAQEAAPGARMPTLAEVFELVDTYEAHDVMLNVETKVEAGAPEETAPRSQFVRTVADEVDTAGMSDQVTIQSFDWGALMMMRDVAPELPIIALTNRDFLQTGEPGASPWLGGIDIDDFDGDLVAAVDSFGADALSPVQGFPQDGAIGDPDFEPYVTRSMVEDSHDAGMPVIPWTVNDRDTMEHFTRLGVDGIITDRPGVLRDVMARRGFDLPAQYRDPSAGRVAPLTQAHAHNDYEHERPLSDALAEGFTSVEAGVWLVDGELLVAHERADLDPKRTLEALYLDPLEQRVRDNDGAVYPGWEDSMQLLVDLKSDGPKTYRLLHRQLREHRDLLTQFAPRVRDGAVEVVVSGNRPLDLMREQRRRWAGYDGRLGDLGSDLSPSLMPLVSDNWANHFSWTGEGPMPPAEQAKLRSLVRRAHSAGYRLRFWGTPDARGSARTTMWSVLSDSGVDHLNTDDLVGLSRFLTVRQ